MKTIATIEARTNSSRLPGKVLKKINGKPMLSFLIERLNSVELIDQVVLATTVNKSDDGLEVLAEQHHIKCFRGSEENVMERVLLAAESVNADVIVETHGDNPMLDPRIIEHAIITFIENDADYLGNSKIHSYPLGMDVQVMRFDALKKSFKMTSDPLDYEHVTLHLKNNPHLFKTINLIAPHNLRRPEIHLTVDEGSDFKLISHLIEKLDSNDFFADCESIINYLDKNANLLKINKSVLRKGTA